MSEPFPFTRAERAEFESTPLSTVASVDPTVPPVSTDQAVLLESGAAPVAVDVSALHAQIQAMQARMDAMSVAAGVPSDPLGAAVANLIAHVKVRASVNPGFDMTDLLDTLDTLTDKPSAQDAELVRLEVDSVLERGSALELHYLKELARNLHKETLKAAKTSKAA